MPTTSTDRCVDSISGSSTRHSSRLLAALLTKVSRCRASFNVWPPTRLKRGVCRRIRSRRTHPLLDRIHAPQPATIKDDNELVALLPCSYASSASAEAAAASHKALRFEAELRGAEESLAATERARAAAVEAAAAAEERAARLAADHRDAAGAIARAQAEELEASRNAEKRSVSKPPHAAAHSSRPARTHARKRAPHPGATNTLPLRWRSVSG